MKACVVPGTFDPITNGHVDIIERAALLFQPVVVAVLFNSLKTHMFSLEDRLEWIRLSVAHLDVTIESFSGLLADFARQRQITVIVRGVRGVTDYEYESSIAAVNRTLYPGLETVILPARDEKRSISSTLARDLILHRADLSTYIPTVIQPHVRQTFENTLQKRNTGEGGPP